MSVSLIVLRFELADDAVKIPDINYNAPYFELPTLEKKTYAEAVERSLVLSKGQLQLYKGRRVFKPLTIETFVTEEIVMDDEDVTLSRSGSEEPRTPGNTDWSPRSRDSTDTDTLSPDKTDEELGAASAAPPVGSSRTKKRSRGVTKPKDKTVLSAVAQEVAEEACSSSRPGSGKTKTKTYSGNTICFFSGNPAVENTEGIIHLYKNDQVLSLTDDVPRSTMVCMLTVPAAMTSQDLLVFVAPVEPWLEHIKIIRDGTPNQYMVLLTFRSQKYADDFYNSFNNITYNSMEPDICHLAYVAKVETLKTSEGASLPVAGLTELPVCPVCLERMDESVDGILTILCNHSFHGSCLAQWGDTTCPVCRYVQTPEAMAENRCSRCEASDNLWICLICGHVGCGRYEGGHAHSHFHDTNHTYSMQLENNRVWDYVGDNYVHRLVQNKGDGKLVEVNEGSNDGEHEKLDSITLEYTYLLTSQLEAQRHHFEDKIERVEKEAQIRVEELDIRSKKALEQSTKLEHQLSSTQKEKQTIEKKYSQMNSKLQKLSTDLEEEREMNKCLRQNQRQWQAKVTEMEKQLTKKDKEVGDMQEQLRDVMFYLEAQQKLSETTAATREEIQEGQIVVQNSATGGATSKRGRKKGGR